MSRLQRLVRRVHAIGTHQCFAFDALSLIEGEAGQRLRRWLVRHYRAYFRGAVDPDVRFRDFHNHVLHAREGFWGGAARVGERWYQRLRDHLRAERFRDAAHAAGVLSHYITDMLQPLHTASDRRESLVHRPMEWSVENCYDEIMAMRREMGLRVEIQLSSRESWIGELMVEAARLSERRFDELVQRYRFQDGIEDPRSGLDPFARQSLAELFAIAITAWARVLERVANECESESGYPIPGCHLGSATMGAYLTSPVAWWRRRLRYRFETTAIRSLAEEYFRTGQLRDNLPAEVDIKQRVIKVYHSERRDEIRCRAA
ncbi:MAG: zinc dependent phospholipase C family protein [Planctomycetota bacterium]